MLVLPPPDSSGSLGKIGIAIFLWADKSEKTVTERKASINFMAVQNMRFAASHANRSELVEPGYLLPEEVRLKNFHVSGYMNEKQLVAEFDRLQSQRTGQAKARKSSAVWEGVMVLPAYQPPYGKYKAMVQEHLRDWAEKFEAKTGCKVMAMIGHMDEGTVDYGLAYNTHAHIFIDRMNGKKNIYSPGRKELSEIQDLTASCMHMQRGETLAERKGRRGRRHIGHAEYRHVAAERVEAVLEASIDVSARVEPIADLREAYGFLRGVLVASKQAKQRDYMALKRLHEAEDARLLEWTELIEIGRLNAADAIELAHGADLDELLSKAGVLAEADEAPQGLLEGEEAPHLEDGLILKPLQRWPLQGRDLYLVPGAQPGQRLAFEDKGDMVRVRLTDDASLRAAVVLAGRKWPKGVVLTGTPDFIARSEDIAAEMGVRVIGRESDFDYSPGM